MSSKTRTCISDSQQERHSFQSIKYQFTPDPNSFLLITYLRGKYILLIFSCIKPRPFKQKWKVLEVTIQDVWRGDTKHHTHSIYIYCLCSVYIYTVILNRAVERRASRCWCSMGNPLHCQGSPVSTGCWEVLGYWVCLSLDQGSYRNRQ